jgi:hypothetical protein
MNGDRDLMLWTAHRSLCTRCFQVDASKTATLALACLEGARLLKELLARTSNHRHEEGVR